MALSGAAWRRPDDALLEVGGALAKRESVPPAQTIYVSIPLGSEGGAPPLTGIYWPPGFQPEAQVDVVLYLHGFKSGNASRSAIDTYWNRLRNPHHPLREALSATRKDVVLVAPTLGPQSQAGRLTERGGLDWYIGQVMAALASHGPHRERGLTPQLGSLILASHSGGGLRMRTLALGSDRAALRIRECWGFDCTYNVGDDTLWARWARSRQGARVFIYYLPNTPTARLAKSLAAQQAPNVFVAPSKAKNHSLVPITHWRERLEGALFLRAGGAAPGRMPISPTLPAPAAPSVPALPRSGERGPQCAPPANLTASERLALAVTTNFETGRPFGCVVSKTDGVSIGMLQWNLKAGTLQAMLKHFEAAGGRLDSFFGPEAAAVRQLINLAPAAAVAKATAENLFERWKGALSRLCSDPVYCGLQVRDIQSRLRQAEAAAQRLGLRTIRGLSMMFDIHVGDGYGSRGRKIGVFADRIRRAGAVGERDKLVVLANAAADLAGKKWGEERRARRLVIARGTSRYRMSLWNLDAKFPGLDQPWTGSALPAPVPAVPAPAPALPVPAPARPVAPTASAPSSQRCPEPSRQLVDRCLRPGTQQCPAIQNLICTKSVSGVPFEYPTKIQRDTATGISVVQARQQERTQRFVPAVQDALAQFIANCRRFRLPFEAILTAGSLYCRCMTGTNKPSNHSFGDAIDLVGVRWAPAGGPTSRLRETVVHNYTDPEQRKLLRRLNACLRLSFATVIDYHHPQHRDHFHCDMNRGRGRMPRGASTIVFVQEALSTVVGRILPQTGKLDDVTQRALAEFGGVPPSGLRDTTQLNSILDRLFTRVAAGS